jgi:hypothetical protein
MVPLGLHNGCEHVRRRYTHVATPTRKPLTVRRV